MAMQNWAGNLTFGATEVVEPQRIDQLQELVSSSARVGVVGAAHSFNDLADTEGVMVSMAGLGEVVEIDSTGRTVTAQGGIRYHVLSQALHDAGWALPNLMSIPHFSVAGACATGTHGSGDGNQGLASAVRSIELVDGHGELVRYSRGDDHFDGVVVNLGALGIATELTLDVQPTFEISQELHLDLPTVTAIDDFDEIMASAYSVSLFTDWQGDTVNQLWRKHLAHSAPRAAEPYRDATPADRMLTPSGEPGDHSMTPQLLRAGPWHQRLPHIDPSFELFASELQSEYFVSRAHARQALQAVSDMSDLLAPVIKMAEVRTVAGDELWLSPFHGDTLALHFSWLIDADVSGVLPALEDGLAPFDPLPHWGKLHTVAPDVIRRGYPRFGDFIELADRHDPHGRFRNRHLDLLLTSSH